MAMLLDTHVLLWYVTENSSLSLKAREIIEAKSGLVFSMVSLWEITVKLNIGKLQIYCSFDDLLARIAVMRAEILPIDIEDTKTYITLPLFPDHRDPFDRLLVAQAMNYGLDIVSGDDKFDAYPIQRVWA